MTAIDFASKLNGREIYSELSPAEELKAKQNGLVVVFGASDDLVEFRGAIDDEVDCYDGGDFYVSKDGVRRSPDGGGRKITAKWCGADAKACWSFETDIPHATFVIHDFEADDDAQDFPYCIGMVFSIESLT